MTQHQDRVDRYFHDEARYWREIYATESVQSAIYEMRRETVLSLMDEIDLAPGSLVLEAGCGAGLTTIALARRGHSVTATDNVARMLRMTDDLAREGGVAERVSTRIADVTRLPFAENTFDAAAAIGVLPWLESLDQPMRELTRVLKPGGYLVASVDNVLALNRILDPRLSPAIEGVKRFLRNLLSRFGGRKLPPRASTHSMRQFDRAAVHAGLQKVRGRTIGFGPFTFWDREVLSNRAGHQLNCKLQRMADRGFPILRSTGAHYIVLARKASRERDNHA